MDNARRDERVIETVFANAARREQDKIPDLLHDDAIVVPFLNRELTLRASEWHGYTQRRLQQGPILEAHAAEITRVEAGRYVVTGRVRVSLATGGFADTGAAWAIVIKDGLIYRMKGAPTAAEARDVLDRDDWSAAPADETHGAA